MILIMANCMAGKRLISNLLAVLIFDLIVKVG